MFNNKNQDRVLAYNKAKEINHDQLKEVSGGHIMCKHGSVGPTGQTGSMDAMVDVGVDW